MSGMSEEGPFQSLLCIAVILFGATRVGLEKIGRNDPHFSMIVAQPSSMAKLLLKNFFGISIQTEINTN